MERWVTGQHLVEQDSECPPVDCLAVALVEENFRSDVLWGSADGVGTFGDDLGESEINHLQVSVTADHDVLGLQVSVDDVQTLEVLEDGHDLGSVECSLLGVEVADASVIGEQVSALEQLGDEVDVPVVLHEAVVFHL